MASNQTMPKVTITFKEGTSSFQGRSALGCVGLILKEDTLPTKNPVIVTDASEIPAEGISDANKGFIKDALKGYNQSPTKVVAFVVAAGDSVEYKPAYDYFNNNEVDYLAVPTVATDNKVSDVLENVTVMRANGLITVAVLPDTGDDVTKENTLDSQGAVCFSTKDIEITDADGNVTHKTAEQMTARIAGILATVPLTESATYISLGSEATGCTMLSKLDKDAAVAAGKMIAFWDGEKVKLGTGVNSFLTTTPQYGEQFQKIRVVRIVDLITSDLHKMIEDNYIGRKANTYPNKLVLVSQCQNYLDQMEQADAISNPDIKIDVLGQKAWLVANGQDVTKMSDSEIEQANTGDEVFLKGSMDIIDAMEQVHVEFTV